MTGLFGARFRWNDTMPKINKEELDKLKPAEKIKKLKELEEESKKEIEEAEKLIKQTQAELEKQGIAESVKVPETKPIDIESLFKVEPGLEGTVKKSAPAEESSSQLYLLAHVYEAAKGLYESEEPLSNRQLEWIDKLGEKVEKISYRVASKEVADLVVATRSIVRKIRQYHTNI